MLLDAVKYVQALLFSQHVWMLHWTLKVSIHDLSGVLAHFTCPNTRCHFERTLCHLQLSTRSRNVRPLLILHIMLHKYTKCHCDVTTEQVQFPTKKNTESFDTLNQKRNVPMQCRSASIFGSGCKDMSNRSYEGKQKLHRSGTCALSFCRRLNHAVIMLWSILLRTEMREHIHVKLIKRSTSACIAMYLLPLLSLP